MPVYGEKARQVAAAYEEIQTILGEHHGARWSPRSCFVDPSTIG